EMLGVVGDLESITGVVGGEIRDQDQGFTRSLLLVIDRDVVDFDLGHRGLPGTARTPRLDAKALIEGYAQASGAVNALRRRIWSRPTCRPRCAARRPSPDPGRPAPPSPSVRRTRSRRRSSCPIAPARE